MPFGSSAVANEPIKNDIRFFSYLMRLSIAALHKTKINKNEIAISPVLTINSDHQLKENTLIHTTDKRKIPETAKKKMAKAVFT
jgi:hypothetical protein